jgi:putative oxidoreductase
MTETTAAASGAAFIARCRDIYAGLAARADVLSPAALLGVRLLVARVFFLSGLTKWNGLTIRNDAYYLFQDEYFARYALPEPLVNAFAVAASIAEIALPLLLALGLLTRFAALGLLIMTLVIQIFVYPDAWWTVHAWWLAFLAMILATGPGPLALDRALGLDGERR